MLTDYVYIVLRIAVTMMVSTPQGEYIKWHFVALVLAVHADYQSDLI